MLHVQSKAKQIALDPEFLDKNEGPLYVKTLKASMREAWMRFENLEANFRVDKS